MSKNEIRTFSNTIHKNKLKMIKDLNVRQYSLMTLIRVLTTLIHEGSTLLTSVQSLSRVRLFVTLWTAARQPSLSTTNSRSLLKFRSMMPSNHLILCHPLLLLPSIFPSIRVFSNGSALCIRWPKYWSFSFNISPSVLTSFDPNYLPMAHLLKPSHWR